MKKIEKKRLYATATKLLKKANAILDGIHNESLKKLKKEAA